ALLPPGSGRPSRSAPFLAVAKRRLRPHLASLELAISSLSASCTAEISRDASVVLCSRASLTSRCLRKDKKGKAHNADSIS
ncbi:unnamed protein product, partial [Urochloa humidicola]